MKDAAAKILPAHELFRDRAPELSADRFTWTRRQSPVR